jgi:hypothetical protein
MYVCIRVSSDVNIFGRTVHGLWDYFNVCIHLSLHALTNRLLHCLLECTTYLLHRQENYYVSLPSHITEVEFSSENMQSLENLLTTEMTLLLQTYKHSDEWRCFSSIKAEILAKLVFEFFSQSQSILETPVLLRFLRLLLWFRRRGALPTALADIQGVDSKQTTTSLFSKKCFQKARGRSIAEPEPESGSKLWSAVSNLLWTGNTSTVEKYIESVSWDGNTISVDLEDSSGHVFASRRSLYQYSLAKTKIDGSLFQGSPFSSLTSIDTSLGAIFSLIETGLKFYPTLDNLSGTVTSNSKSTVVLNAEGNVDILEEIDAVLLLQWAHNILTANSNRVGQVWHCVHGII